MASPERSPVLLNGSELHISNAPSGRLVTNGQSHGCCGACWRLGTTAENSHLYSPLDIPLRLGWNRVVTDTEVYYTAPCGKKIESIEEVLVFLLDTKVKEIHISQFTFDPHCQLETQTFSGTVCIKDISDGKEQKPISCVNTVNAERPDSFEYITERTHQPNVPLLTESEPSVSCSCTNGCRNRSDCQCSMLTFKEGEKIQTRHTVGYVYGRSRGHQYSGIFECNSGCSCGPQCVNRVVQHGLTHRLQVFRSQVEELKWGVRSLDDIPQGMFVCTYIGHIYSEAESDKQADDHGDAYFAELDYIEVMQQKEACTDALSADSSPSSLSSNSSHLSIDFPTSSLRSSRTSIDYSLTSSRLDLENGSDLDSLPTDNSDIDESDLSGIDTANIPLDPKSQEALINGYNVPPIPPPLSLTSYESPTTLPHTLTSTPTHSPNPQPPSSPCFSPWKGGAFIMDAKKKGNIGRFINHSCSPNLFVQNVFIDTHDRRFPWVALFAKRLIKAGEELTWDYNYQVESLPDRFIKCLCGSKNCRQRLL